MNRLKPFGGILLLIGMISFGITYSKYNSIGEQLGRAFGGSDPTILYWGAIAMAQCVAGVLLLTSEPRVFLRLTTTGLIVFVVLAGLIPFLCWLPWIIPGLKQKAAVSA